MRTLRAIILICLAGWLEGCAAPKDSATHFNKRKYRVETRRPHPGRAAVRQTWWDHLWFWQRNHAKHPVADGVGSPKYTPSR
jgi:hypothetical protein